MPDIWIAKKARVSINGCDDRFTCYSHYSNSMSSAVIPIKVNLLIMDSRAQRADSLKTCEDRTPRLHWTRLSVENDVANAIAYPCLERDPNPFNCTLFDLVVTLLAYQRQCSTSRITFQTAPHKEPTGETARSAALAWASLSTRNSWTWFVAGEEASYRLESCIGTPPPHPLPP